MTTDTSTIDRATALNFLAALVGNLPEWTGNLNLTARVLDAYDCPPHAVVELEWTERHPIYGTDHRRESVYLSVAEVIAEDSALFHMDSQCDLVADAERVTDLFIEETFSDLLRAWEDIDY